MTGEHSRLHEVIDDEIAQAAAGADALGDDEPERDPLVTRLRSLHEAVVAVDGSPDEG